MKDLHQDWRGRKQAIAEMAGEHGQRRAITAAQLVELIERESLDLSVLNGALQTLVALGSSALPRLQPLLVHPSSEVRQAAAVVLGQLKAPLGVPLLLLLLEDSHTNVRYHAVEALGQQRSLAAVAGLTELACGHDAFLAFAALEALAQIGDPAVLPDLCALLKDPLLAGSAAEAWAVSVIQPRSPVCWRSWMTWTRPQPPSRRWSTIRRAKKGGRCWNRPSPSTRPTSGESPPPWN